MKSFHKLFFFLVKLIIIIIICNTIQIESPIGIELEISHKLRRDDAIRDEVHGYKEFIYCSLLWNS